MQTRHETEVVVIGGGVVGCSIAFWLAKRGKDVILVDMNAPGTGTSVACSGLIGGTFKFPNFYMELSIRSAYMYPKMGEELGEEIGLRQDRGFLSLCLTEETYKEYSSLREEHLKSPVYRGRMMAPREVWEIQPGVSREIVGAHYNPDDGDCEVLRLMYVLIRACQRVGVRMLRDAAVTGFALGGDNRVEGVVINHDYLIRAPNAVNAAGVWATEVAKMVGVTIDLYPDRGQLLITEPAPMICPTPMNSLKQVRTGHFHIGTVHELVGFDVSVTPTASARMTKNAIKSVPIIADLAVIRQFSGLRGMTRDGIPCLGAVSRVPGYYIAAGHSGITLAPVHGKVISDLIVDGRTDLPIDEYDPLRFERKNGSQS
jgi:sarcosine oxidase subunit beta